MQFLHLTAAKNIPAIQAEGLKPAAKPKHGRCSLWWPHDCVWFTREARVTWWGDPSLYARFVCVVLPSSDKRLMSLERWLRDHLGNNFDECAANLDEDVGTSWHSHYVYFGIVPPHRIKVVGETVSTPPSGEQEAA